MKLRVINRRENFEIFLGHGNGGDGYLVIVRHVIVNWINIYFDLVLIVSAAAVDVDAGVKVATGVREGRGWPGRSGGGGGGGGRRVITTRIEHGQDHGLRRIETESIKFIYLTVFLLAS